MEKNLEEMAIRLGVSVTDREFALGMDNMDRCGKRDHFFYPKMSSLPEVDFRKVNANDDAIYLCGNSLGLQPKRTPEILLAELEKWAQMGVQGWHYYDDNWLECNEAALKPLGKIVGASPAEVGIMNSLSVNLHLLMISFYRPSKDRFKILLESRAFPSDHYVVESQMRLHGFDPETAMICMEPRQGEETLRDEDIVKRLEEEGDSIALVLFSGIQYYTGQFFDIPLITQAAHNKGCTVGWDLAHAVGNVPLRLNEWGVDFAAWCNYKYVTAGPGGVGGMFIHQKHANNSFPKLQGWWGHKLETRFKMDNKMDLAPGPAGYRLSTPAILLEKSLIASLEIFEKTSMEEIREKSKLLSGYLEYLIDYHFGEKSKHRQTTTHCRILTPRDPERRGAQISISFSVDIHSIFTQLIKRGVLCDKRLPHVIRVGPAPLYNQFQDVFRFVATLQNILMDMDNGILS